MTINKAQGQSLHTVGIDLRSPVFTHGQLNVAFTRITDIDGLDVLLPEQNDGQVDNILVVYPEALLE